MSVILLPMLTFLAIVLAFAGAYSLFGDMFFRDRALVRQRLDDEFKVQIREQAKKSPLFKDLAKVAAQLPGEAGSKANMRERFQLVLDQSGLKITLQRLLMISAAMALVLGGVGGMWRRSLLVGAILAVLSAGLPFVYVYWKRRAKIEKLLAQLPEAFDLMARVIRVGQTPARAMQAVAAEFERPISAEFAFCYEQQNLGLPSNIVLRDLAHRNGVLELHIFVIAILVQQQTGGSLAEMMDSLAVVVRERLILRDKVKTLTAEGRMQALVLMALPPFMFGVMLLINRRYALTLFEFPMLLIGGLVSMGLGALWIRKIVNFEV
jgi:tight adherence protein B